MVEKDFQNLFNTWAKENKQQLETGAYELKICKGKSIRFDAVAPQQRIALLAVESTGHYYKINDMPWIKDRPYSFTQKKPFDCFVLRGLSFVVVLWYVPRQKKIAYFIRINGWLKEEVQGNRQSLTEERAEIISSFQVSKWT